MSALDILRRARARIEDPARWCQGALARDEHDAALDDPDDSRACRWCAEGAFVAEGGESDSFEWYALSNSAECGVPHLVNDVHGHAAVLAMFDRAIARAEAA